MISFNLFYSLNESWLLTLYCVLKISILSFVWRLYIVMEILLYRSVILLCYQTMVIGKYEKKYIKRKPCLIREITKECSIEESWRNKILISYLEMWYVGLPQFESRIAYFQLPFSTKAWKGLWAAIILIATHSHPMYVCSITIQGT